MANELLTKRLHISGLTPSITPTDLERRLAAFGTVRAMDGFGARDALGDPRKFAYVTMEIGAKELAKCLNVLSGSTWKGTKLRIGEAKPNFRERIARINSLPPRPARPKRSYTRNHGHPSPNIPLSALSPTTAASTPGWIVTPSGRIVRPMRMRPERPLEPVRSLLTASKGRGGKIKAGKVKRRTKPPLVRARRRKIDPTAWDSVYLKGVFLDSVPFPPSIPGHVVEAVEGEGEDEDEEMSNGVDSEAGGSDAHEHEPTVPPSTQAVPSSASTTDLEPLKQDLSASSAPLPQDFDIRHETNTALTLLGDMFGDGEDWGGSESIDEMEGVESVAPRKAERTMEVDGEYEIEVVPRDHSQPHAKKDKAKSEQRPTVGSECTVKTGSNEYLDKEMSKDGSPAPSSASAMKSAQAAPRTTLKDLFAPREEEASFSLLGHLDLDLELEDDILGIGALSSAPHAHVQSPVSQPVPALPQPSRISTATPTSNAHSRITLDPSLPLLFPLPEHLPHRYALPTDDSIPIISRSRSTSSCFLFPPRGLPTRSSHNLNFLPSSNTFARSPSDTSESIRAQWENDKGALTHEWKRAWREARGGRKGRGGGGGDE
ncbi:hypothetical protein PAXRUDRAFT_149238 [Paxillus rubicundulus Ve08.2h10]|uniref:Unplaced genomic scaffold scaffold_552, whole genome shotgun sequence n=1 Tax=Paxillus rubicundulus Ve08.2h10 TaxID=930991 RepID=A0A0D0DYA9_9AGAM|nr:hypothetical protein PAXRUDRAFT_149238 [Paxillus rubicundulus Ve08.2h10]